MNLLTGVGNLLLSSAPDLECAMGGRWWDQAGCNGVIGATDSGRDETDPLSPCDCCDSGYL
jgi:hypothetical protein